MGTTSRARTLCIYILQTSNYIYYKRICCVRNGSEGNVQYGRRQTPLDGGDLKVLLGKQLVCSTHQLDLRFARQHIVQPHQVSNSIVYVLDNATHVKQCVHLSNSSNFPIQLQHFETCWYYLVKINNT